MRRRRDPPEPPSPEERERKKRKFLSERGCTVCGDDTPDPRVVLCDDCELPSVREKAHKHARQVNERDSRDPVFAVAEYECGAFDIVQEYPISEDCPYCHEESLTGFTMIEEITNA